jgi:hypothetical protein
VSTYHFGATDAQYAPDVAFDAGGALVACASFGGTVDFNGMPLTSVGTRDAYVFKLSAAGAPMWARVTGDTGLQTCDGIDTDAADDVWLTGDYENSVDFGGGTLSAVDGADIFLVELDASGGHKWSMTTGAAGDDEGEGVAIGPDGSVHVVGSFTTSIDFGEGVLQSAGGQDAFVVKLRP